MERYINDDILIMFKQTVPAITEDELKQRLCDAVRIHCDDYDYKDYLDAIECFADDEEDEEDPLPWGHAVSILLNRSNRIDQEKDIWVDHENIRLDWSEWDAHWCGTNEPANYLGVHTINGFTFCGVETGGDWEHPIFLILYWDGNDIHTYIPKRGNTVNMDAMTAFGSESETMESSSWCNNEEEFSSRGKVVLAKYANLGICAQMPENMHDDFCWSDLYIKQYGYALNKNGYIDIPFNWEAMMSEIQECFIVI